MPKHWSVFRKKHSSRFCSSCTNSTSLSVATCFKRSRSDVSGFGAMWLAYQTKRAISYISLARLKDALREDFDAIPKGIRIECNFAIKTLPQLIEWLQEGLHLVTDYKIISVVHWGFHTSVVEPSARFRWVYELKNLIGTANYRFVKLHLSQAMHYLFEFMVCNVWTILWASNRLCARYYRHESFCFTMLIRFCGEQVFYTWVNLVLIDSGTTNPYK